jgi:hypothetical protein
MVLAGAAALDGGEDDRDVSGELHGPRWSGCARWRRWFRQDVYAIFVRSAHLEKVACPLDIGLSNISVQVRSILVDLMPTDIHVQLRSSPIASTKF